MTLSGHPAGSLCCGDPAVLGLWVRSFHVLQQIIDGVNIGEGHVITQDLGLGSCRVVLSDGKWGQLSHTHDFRAGSPRHPLTLLNLLCCRWWGTGPALPSIAADRDWG